jgi:hypothetical protein
MQRVARAADDARWFSEPHLGMPNLLSLVSPVALTTAVVWAPRPSLA